MVFLMKTFLIEEFGHVEKFTFESVGGLGGEGVCFHGAVVVGGHWDGVC